MKKFIAYFDYLGFKKFIENNTLDDQKNIMQKIFLDIEMALGKPSGGKIKLVPGAGVPDLSNMSINGINFSDTVVFWTIDDSEDSLKDILEVAYYFNFLSVIYTFPVRGSLVYGEIEYVPHLFYSERGATHSVNSVFGKGLVTAHGKAEMQHWAGTVIDDSFIIELESRMTDIEPFLKPYAKKYKVPYKGKPQSIEEEYALRLTKGEINEDVFKSRSDNITRNFAQYNKPINSQDVQQKMENTIGFLRSFC